jgi:hypothetical protein
MLLFVERYVFPVLVSLALAALFGAPYSWPVRIGLFCGLTFLALLISHVVTTRRRSPQQVPVQPTVFVAAEPPKIPHSLSAELPRSFITLSDKDFEALNGLTTHQLRQRTQDYVGCWTRVSGHVRDVTVFTSDRIQVWIDWPSNWPEIDCYFDAGWYQRIVILHQGDQVTIAGRITTFTRSQLETSNNRALRKERTR